jgi:predicted O-methyltransferase YrrM
MSHAAAVTDVLSSSEMQSIRNVDRLLPSQPVMRKLFDGDAQEFHVALEALTLSVCPTPVLAQRWQLEFKPGVSYASLGSDIGALHFYQLLIRLSRARRVLELGTYVGVSTLYLAEAVGPDGMVTTVEKGDEFFAIAQRNFQRNGMSQRIRALRADAMEALCELADEGEEFDLILIDAAKESYAAMLAPALKCLPPGGLLVVDDIFMNGDTLNAAPNTVKGQGVQDLLKLVKNLRPEHTRVVLPIGNGTLLIHRSPHSGPTSANNRNLSRVP